MIGPVVLEKIFEIVDDDGRTDGLSLTTHYDPVPLIYILHSADFVKKKCVNSRNKVHFSVEKIAV